MRIHHRYISCRINIEYVIPVDVVVVVLICSKDMKYFDFQLTFYRDNAAIKCDIFNCNLNNKYQISFSDYLSALYIELIDGQNSLILYELLSHSRVIYLL